MDFCAIRESGARSSRNDLRTGHGIRGSTCWRACSVSAADEFHARQGMGLHAVQRFAEVALGDATVLAHQRLGAGTLAILDRVEHLPMLVLRDQEHVARGGRVRLY